MQPETSKVAPETVPILSVLVVEDDPAHATIIQKAFRESKLTETKLVATGEEAITRLVTTP